MQATEQSLIDVGLTLTESKIYLAGLSRDSVTIQDLGRSTKIKRPTLYHALGTLTEKGLVTEKKVRNKSHYTMSNPEAIRGLVALQREELEKRAGKLDALIPLLAQQGSADRDDVQVVQYHGIDGMKMVMDMAFYCKSKRWDVIAPYANFLREYDAEYAQRYLRARKYYGITSRALWEEGMRSRELTEEEIRDRAPRLMPKEMQGKFKSMIFLFDDKIAIFAPYEKLSAILITSRDMNSMFSAVFEGLWQAAKPYQV